MQSAIFVSSLLGCALVAAEGPKIEAEVAHLADLATATDGDYVSGGEIK